MYSVVENFGLKELDTQSSKNGNGLLYWNVLRGKILLWNGSFLVKLVLFLTEGRPPLKRKSPLSKLMCVACLKVPARPLDFNCKAVVFNYRGGFEGTKDCDPGKGLCCNSYMLPHDKQYFLLHQNKLTFQNIFIFQIVQENKLAFLLVYLWNFCVGIGNLFSAKSHLGIYIIHWPY